MKLTLLLSGAFALGFVVGVSIAAWHAITAFEASPYHTPRTAFVDALGRELQRAACEAARKPPASSPSVQPSTPVAVLDAFSRWSGVALFDRGERVMPDRTRVHYSGAVRLATEGLVSACVALHDAADLLREFGESLPYQKHRELRTRNMAAVISVDRALGFDRADATLAAARRDSSFSCPSSKLA